MRREDLESLGIGLLLTFFFFLPVTVYWLNRWARNRENRRARRSGFEILPPAPPAKDNGNLPPALERAPQHVHPTAPTTGPGCQVRK
jgi:hypothetical protein